MRLRAEDVAVCVDGARRRRIGRLGRVGMKRNVTGRHRHAAVLLLLKLFLLPATRPGRLRYTWWRGRVCRRASRPCIAVKVRRAPLMPSGWPSAMAPPCGLTWSASSARPSWRRHGDGLRGERFVELDQIEIGDLQASRSNSLCVEGTGPMPMMRGGTAAEAMPRTRARGFRPCGSPHPRRRGSWRLRRR